MGKASSAAGANHTHNFVSGQSSLTDRGVISQVSEGSYTTKNGDCRKLFVDCLRCDDRRQGPLKRWRCRAFVRHGVHLVHDIRYGNAQLCLKLTDVPS
jgi:hypothetical protein